MGFSRLLVCATAFTLVLQSSASRGVQKEKVDQRGTLKACNKHRAVVANPGSVSAHCDITKDVHFSEQREVTSELDKIMQEREPPDSFILQKEVDLSELLDPMDFSLEQREVFPKLPPNLGDRGRPHFVRSFASTPLEDYYVQFPLAQPTSGNLQAICLHSERRPRYPESYFPASGFGYQRRRGDAVNKVESWFTTCCQRNETWGREVTLCCATQAWEQSIDSFCEEEFMIKTSHYHCCKRTGADRLNCFNNNAVNPDYSGTEELPVPPLESTASFDFDPNTCLGTAMAPKSVRGNRRKKVKEPSSSLKVDINFPPGRPHPDTINSLCKYQKLRPLYAIKCLPGQGYGWLARQAKTVNRIEKGFKRCCKVNQNVLKCADDKWREELDKFCRGENGKYANPQCCSPGDGAADRYTCFQNIAPRPHYNMTSSNEAPSLNKICDFHKIIKKKLPSGISLKTSVSQCCPLSGQNKTNCLEQRLKETSENLCLTKRHSSPAVRRCCRTASQDPSECVSKFLMEAIAKAAISSSQKTRKRCPLS